MKNLSVNEIRRKWIDFFVSKGHKEEMSASLVPQNDPTLLWINSGVAALKKYFDGTETPSNPRIVNSQKSLRTNDIDNVGISARHHTLFEMLGNFSIGDYFKEEAIEFAFEFLTKELELPTSKLFITVFHEDTDTYNKWISLGIDPKHIVKCGKDRNFWEIGEGPSGPCTEIFFDRGEKYDPKNIGQKLFDEDIENDRYIEIWNVVFSQFYHDGKGNYAPLKRKNIDTGAGLERLACVLQQVPTNFETDYFMPIIKEIEGFTKFKYDATVYFWNDHMIDDGDKKAKQEKINSHFKIIADHIRASVLAISDGCLPSNKDRGYVIRRLIRRSVVNARKLGITQPILSSLVGIVIKMMSQYYTELKTKKKLISKIIFEEELKFAKTIDKGMKIIETNKGEMISGKEAFTLFDTFGFPLELTVEYAKDHNMEVDLKGFDKEFARHQEASKGDAKTSSMSKQKTDLLDYDRESKFLYDTESVSAKVIGCFDEEFNKVSEINVRGWIILDQTCFYAESGGQVADSGTINGFQVVDVQKAPNGQHMHLIEGGSQVGENAIAKIDVSRRNEISKNHSATHLLHEALSEVISDDAKQRGAYYDDSRLRFDFFSPLKVKSKKYDEINEFVNEKIKAGINKEEFNTSLENAREMGANALFSDKYGEVVRVIKFGHSIELCAGTHVKNTAMIEQFMITKTESKGTGVFRIEAIVTKERIKKYLESKFVELTGVYESVKKDYQNTATPNEDIVSLLAQYTNTPTQSNYKKQLKNIDELKSLIHAHNKIEQQKMEKFQKGEIKELFTNSIQKITNSSNLITHHTTKYSRDIIREVINELKNEYKDLCICVLVETENSNMYMVGVSDSLTKELPAGDVLKHMNTISNGRGGGMPQLAQGNAGSDIELCRKAIQTVGDYVKGKLCE